jgi:hypothetical protein
MFSKAKQEAMHSIDKQLNAIIQLVQTTETLKARYDMLVRQTADNLHKLKVKGGVRRSP